MCCFLVRVDDELLAVSSRLVENVHRLLKALVASRNSAAGERHVEGKVVDVHVAGIGDVGSSVGIAIHGCLRIFETASTVDGGIRYQRRVRVADRGMTLLEFGGAVLLCGEVSGQLRKIAIAEGRIGVASGVENLSCAHK